MARLALPRFTLSQRIQFALAVVVAVAAAAMAYIAVSLNGLARLAASEQQATEATQAAYQLEVETLHVMVLMLRYRDIQDMQALFDIEVSRTEADRLIKLLRARSSLPEASQALDRYKDLERERVAVANTILAAVDSGKNSQELTDAIVRREALDAEVRNLLQVIIDAEQHELDRIRASAEQARSAFARNSLVVTLAAVFIIGALLYRVVAGGVTSRLNQLTAMARQIAAGDYSQREFGDARDEIGELAQTFNEMAGQLAEFDKVKEEFVALASHQLRTPATAVKGNLGMLLEGFAGDLTSEQRELLGDANQSNERQLAVIEDMLWVARTDSGRLVLAKSAIDMSQLVAEVAAEQMRVIDGRRQTLAVRKPDEPVTVEADGQKIRMVCENLLSNASKYTPEGGAITVALTDAGATVAIAVSDTGVGIPAKDRHKLFNKFSRIFNPLSDHVGGTGLGLYLANEIVKLHGGGISVESEAGAGTTFTVTLPRA